MRILYLEWNENTSEDMIEALQNMGHAVMVHHIECKDYENDAVCMERLEKAAVYNQCEIMFSFDYFPVAAKMAKKLQVDYLAWVYDCPHHTLHSPSVWNLCNYIFVFDYQQYQQLKGKGISHVWHLPLAVNVGRLNRSLGIPASEQEYRAEVSFVGGLYEKNMFDRINWLPKRLQGYLDGMLDVQKNVFGADLLEELLVGQLAEELDRYVKLDENGVYGICHEKLYADMLRQKLTSMERIEYLNRIAQKHELHLYSNSDVSLVPAAVWCGTVSYREEMPRVFAQSAINLNITLRSIASGMPLRALDIMGAGGFLLSNYQPELAEYFVDGEELVLYGGKEDLLEKVQYYLEHEAKRREIAYGGWKKVQREFSYERQIGRMFEIWEDAKRRL